MIKNEIGATSGEMNTSKDWYLQSEEYFNAVGHLSLIENIVKDIESDVPLVVVTGEEGCGKSVAGAMLAAEGVVDGESIYFEKTIESFEDVVSLIAQCIGVELADITRSGISLAIEDIATGIEQRGMKLVLICDGAERTFLATLERMRKMLDRVNRNNVYLHFVFIGRKGLLDNLQQLQICNFEEVLEERYILEPLSFSGTSSYLEFLNDKLPEADAALLTSDAVEHIFQESGGNFRKIDGLVRELCNRHGKDASFWVLLENVEGGMAKAGSRIQHHWKSFLGLKGYSVKKIAIGGTALLFCLLLYLAYGGNETDSIPPVKLADEPIGGEEATQLESSLTGVAPVVKQDEHVSAVSDDQSHEIALPKIPELVTDAKENATGSKGYDGGAGPLEPLDSEPSVLSVVDQGSENHGELMELSEFVEEREKAEALIAEAIEAVESAKVEGSVSQTEKNNTEKMSGTDQVKPVLRAENPKKKVIPPLPIAKHSLDRSSSIAEASPLVLGVNGSKVSYIEGEVEKKRIVSESSVPPPVRTGALTVSNQVGKNGVTTDSTKEQVTVIKGQIVENEGKKIPVLNQVILPEKVSRDGSGIYSERIAAGRSWLKAQRDSYYTLQLMALSADNAEANVREIFSKDEYRERATELYIVEKKGEHSTTFVFLGEYSSFEDAKAAMESLPESFLKSEPYILSVGDAVKKAQ